MLKTEENTGARWGTLEHPSRDAMQSWLLVLMQLTSDLKVFKSFTRQQSKFAEVSVLPL